MLRKYFSLVFSGLLIGAVVTSPITVRATLASVSKQEQQVAKHKKRIVEWGTNKRVVVKLKSGDKIDGRVSEIKDNNFSVQLVEQGQVVNREISYGEIQSLSGKNGTSGAKIAGWIVLGAAASVGTLVLIGLALAD
jgi:small nuclear ribonucleoprotein (snRNP)-like protein